MKQLAIFLLLLPFCASAQLKPELIPGYSDPNDINKPFDAGYVPARNYLVESYYLNDDETGFDLNTHYEIELDDKFMLRRILQYFDNIDSNSIYNLFATDYTYNKGQLVCTTSSRRRVNDSILYIRNIDSTLYDAGLIVRKNSWDVYVPYFVKYRSASIYKYDALKRFTGYKPETKTMDSNTLYAGYSLTDSFTLSNKPARIWVVNYFYTSEDPYSKNGYSLLFYDSYNRVINSKRLGDSTVYHYTGTKQYPDSILNYGPDKLLSWKRIYEYTPSGSISQMLYYTKRASGLIVTYKQVYAPIVHSALEEKVNAIPDFRIMPNPTQGSFTLQLAEKYADCIVSITNILGEEVYKQQQNNTIEISLDTHLKPGIYFVTIAGPSGLLSKKLIIH